MSYVVLARRRRPQRFADLIGQDVVVRTIKNAVASGQIAHAYLFTGIRGVGKTTLARLLAMAVNCENGPSVEPCGECPACKEIVRGASLDVQEMDAASHTSVEDIREILEHVRYPPTNLKNKVYIIDEAHMLSKSAFNALLKTLEEPPERVIFILATTEVEKLPATVRSRCQRFDLRRLGQGEISAYLAHVLGEEGIAFEAEALAEIARAAEGSVRDALSLVERVLAFSGDKLKSKDVQQALGLVAPVFVREFSEAVFRGDAPAAITCLRRAMEAAHSPRALLLAVGELWHQLACTIADPGLLEDEVSEEGRVWLQRWAACWDGPTLDLRYQVLVRGLADLALMDERRGAEMLALRLCGLNDLAPPAGLPADVEKPQPAAASTGEKAEHVQKKNADAEGDLLLRDQAPGRECADWATAVTAYKQIRPHVAAVLEHVRCLDFGPKVRLALDAHQERMLDAAERLAFAEWLGREVHWEPKAGQDGESLSETLVKQAEAKRRQLWQAAGDDPHVQLLQRELGAELVRVQAPGAQQE